MTAAGQRERCQCYACGIGVELLSLCLVGLSCRGQQAEQALRRQTLMPLAALLDAYVSTMGFL